MRCGHRADPVAVSSVGLAAGVLRAGRPLTDVLADIAGGVVAALAVHPPGRRLPGAPMTLQHGRLRGRAVAVPGLPRAELIVTLAAPMTAPVPPSYARRRGEPCRPPSPPIPRSRWSTWRSTPSRWQPRRSVSGRR